MDLSRRTGINTGWRGQGTRPTRAYAGRAARRIKTAIGSRGWINAALTRRYRARRVRSRCGTLRHVGFALVAAEARILLASSFVSMAMRRADGLPVPFVALGAAGADLWVGG